MESQTQRKKGLSDPTPPGTKSLGHLSAGGRDLCAFCAVLRWIVVDFA